MLSNYHVMRVYSKAYFILNKMFKTGITGKGHMIISPHSVIRNVGKGIHFGSNGFLNFGSYIKCHDGPIVIGDDFSLHSYSIVYGHAPITIGNGVRIAAHVTIVSADHEMSPDLPIHKQGMRKKGIIIEDDVWIATGAKILDGAHIAKGCVIGANAVVKGKTEPYGVYAGVPARKIRNRN